MSEKKTRKTPAPKRARVRAAATPAAGKQAPKPMNRGELERLREKLRRKFH